MKVLIRAHPQSKKPKIELLPQGILNVFVKEPTREEKANRAILEALAGYYKIAKSRVLLIKGHKSRNKTFLIKL